MEREKVAHGKNLSETSLEQRKKRTDLRQPIKTAVFTAAGAGVGVLGVIAGITVASVFEIALPIGLCLWAGGVTFGAIGLALGAHKKKEISANTRH